MYLTSSKIWEWSSVLSGIIRHRRKTALCACMCYMSKHAFAHMPYACTVYTSCTGSIKLWITVTVACASECSSSSSVSSSILSAGSGGESRPIFFDRLCCPRHSHLGRKHKIDSNQQPLKGKRKANWKGCWGSQVCWIKPKSELISRRKTHVFPIEIGNAEVFIFNFHYWLCTSNFYTCSCI